MPITLDDIDLSDPDLYATGDPHALWSHLRENAPVFFHTHGYGPGFWAITKYVDVLALSSDRRLSSAGGRSTLGKQAMDGTDILVCTDPPRHTQVRALVNKAFTPRVVASLEGYIQAVVDGLVDAAIECGSCDFAREVAARVPHTVICELLGVPEKDRGPLSHAVGQFMESREARVRSPRAGERDNFDLAQYFLDLANSRRMRPEDDLISHLAIADIDGAGLSDADILALAMLLFIAGAETTMNSISGGLLAFLEHPDQRARIEADPSLWPRAVEEILRWVSPVLDGMVRTATDEIVVRDATIAAGDKVTLWYPSANRDDEVFVDPFRFDVAREVNNHVTFGAGPHYCLGASLARSEIRITMQNVFSKTKSFELDGEMTRLRSNVSHAVESLPVTLVRR